MTFKLQRIIERFDEIAQDAGNTADSFWARHMFGFMLGLGLFIAVFLFEEWRVPRFHCIDCRARHQVVCVPKALKVIREKGFKYYMKHRDDPKPAERG